MRVVGEIARDAPHSGGRALGEVRAANRSRTERSGHEPAAASHFAVKMLKRGRKHTAERSFPIYTRTAIGAIVDAAVLVIGLVGGRDERDEVSREDFGDIILGARVLRECESDGDGFADWCEVTKFNAWIDPVFLVRID